METKSFILVVGSMKQYCLNCNKVFYPTENNWIGYPQYWGGYWDNEEERYISNNVEIPLENKVFHSRSCMDSFLTKNANVLTPIFKQIKEREGNNARTRENQTELAETSST